MKDDYGRRHVSIPTPATGELSADTSLKPAGTQAVASDRARDALVSPEFYYGSGRVVADPLGQTGVTTGPTGDTVSLNFVETGILEVVDVVLGQTLGLNYVIDGRVQGTVTARTSKQIARSAVLPVLENILALNGAALVESEGVYNVVPVDSVASLPKVVVTPSRRSQQPGIGVYVIPLEFASATSVEDIVAAQVSPGNKLAVDRARNILIYTGPAREAQAISEMVSVLDIDVLAGMSFALFPVQSTSAEDVADELSAVFSDEAIGGVNSEVRFLPITRLNAILAIAARPAQLKHAGDWVARLDRADAAAGERVFVYYARNRRAGDLADVLNQVFQGTGRKAAKEPSRIGVAPGLQPVEIIAPLREVQDAGQGAVAEPVPAATAAPEDFAVDDGGGGIRQISSESGINFIADDGNNAVVVTATAEQFRMIEATLQRLDILPLQVLIEATIAEVRLNDALQYGLQWAFESGNFRTSSTSNNTGAVTETFPGFNLVLDAADANIALRALSEITDVEVISSPHLMVLDNQPARLQVGDQVPIAIQSSVSTIGDSQLINSIQYFDTGVILEVTPRVNAGGLVTLEIVQEVSDAIATETSGINSPTIQQRSIRSSVAIQSGETVALGGLIRESSSDTVSGIPILKDIPVLGNLFKSTDRSSDRNELLVLITPRVVRGAAQAREITDELRRRLTILRDVVASNQ
ncbi:MAG TPA: type II secretion system secretin GspD [Thermohalobaculum sp.]|nr:type II secretion system secretin GspD [Thermohalobaculum sp.]